MHLRSQPLEESRRVMALDQVDARELGLKVLVLNKRAAAVMFWVPVALESLHWGRL